MKERWRAVVGYEGLYEVSDRGRVRSLDHVAVRLSRWGTPSNYVSRGRLRRRSKSNGYWSITLSKEGIVASRPVHTLLLEAFVGPRPKGYQGTHDDGDPGNCTLSNLKWKTVSENSLDRRRHGTMPRGETSGLSKLTEKAVVRIRKLCANGMTQRAVASLFGVKQQAVSKIVSRKRWSHVK